MKLHLRVLSGLQVGDQGHLEPPGGLIGRGEDCALHLRDGSVSRSHLELRYQQDGWWAFQRSASSPSVLDGVPLGLNPLALRERGVLQVGSIAVEYTREQYPLLSEELDSPPTMINVRRQLPAIQHAVLPQMTPMRAAELPPSDTPATLIIRRQPAPSSTLPPAEAPPTLIRRAPAAPPPLPAAVSLDRDSPTTEPAAARALAQVEKERDRLRLERDQLRLERDQLHLERDQLRLERDQLAAERRKLAQENTALQQAQSRPTAGSQSSLELAAQALLLLQPFSDSLEQASVAFQDGNVTGARTLLREASFGLADLRDLFESAG